MFQDQQLLLLVAGEHGNIFNTFDFFMRHIDKVVVHHSVSPRDQTLEKSVASFNRNHRERLHPFENSLGYFISYHYVIAHDGRWLKTRGLDEVGYHASNRQVNNTSVGICLIGNFDIEKPTKHQLLTFRYLLSELQNKYNGIQVHFHNEYSGKSCPGNNITLDLLLQEGMKTSDYIIPDRDGVIYRHMHSRPAEINRFRAIIMVNNAVQFRSPFIGKSFRTTKYIQMAHLQIFTEIPEELDIEFPPNGLAKGGFGKVFFNDEVDRKNDYSFLYGCTHEVGHAIGCEHCDNEGCVMNPMYRDLHENMKLCDRHKEDLQSKYL